MGPYNPQTVELPGDLVTLNRLLELRPFATTRRIRHLRETGQLAVYRFGQRKILVSLADFDALIQREQIEPQ